MHSMNRLTTPVLLLCRRVRMALHPRMYVISFMQVGLWTSYSRERAGCRKRQLVNLSAVLKSSREKSKHAYVESNQE